MRRRALVVGLAVGLLNVLWLSYDDVGVGMLHNYMSLFSNAVFTLFVVLLLNLLLGVVRRQWALRNSELLLIYVMTVMTSTVCGHPSMSHLVGVIAHPYRFATVENDWQNLFWRHIPDWLVVRDKDALEGFFEGQSTFLAPSRVRAWMAPMLVWVAFMFVIYFLLLCLNVVMRKQFTDHERLTYPITHLPLQLAGDPKSYLKSRLLWVGFGLAAAISILNGLAMFIPSLPTIPVGWRNIRPQTKPWRYMSGTLMSFQPFVIGLSFFMPLDLTFSAWFLYTCRKVAEMVAGTLAVRTIYLDEQAQGAWVGLGLLAVWSGRRHIASVFRIAASTARSEDDSGELMSYRTAMIGIAVCVLFLSAFAYRAGLSMWLMGVFLVIYCAQAIAVAKVRGSLGVPVHEMLWIDPGRTIVSTFGGRTLGPRNATLLSFFYWLNREQVAHPMPNQLEAIRMGEQGHISPRRLATGIVVAVGVGIPVAFVIYLLLTYHTGAAGGSFILGIGKEAFGRLERNLVNPQGPSVERMVAMATGAGITTVLLAARLRFLWWPFHPVGYVLATSPAELVYIWFPVMISWTVKLVVLRYGGLRAYRQALPFFAGLVLGDYTLASVWRLIGAVLRTATYNMAWHSSYTL